MGDMTVTTSGQFQDVKRRKNVIRYYWRIARWMYQHRTETNCRQKWRRMERDLKE